MGLKPNKVNSVTLPLTRVREGLSESVQGNRLVSKGPVAVYRDTKKKKVETHKIGLVGQAPSRRGDPRKPLAGPNGQKIARLAGMSYDELVACRRRHLNTHYNVKRGEGSSFDCAKGNVNAADILMDWRVERIVLLGKNVARCFGFRDLPFLAQISIYGRRFLIFPHPSGVNRWWNERRNERRARQLLQRFLRGETASARSRKSSRASR